MAKSLKDEFNDCIQASEGLESLGLRQDSLQYQEKLSSTIQQWLLFQRATTTAFSNNETIEDLNTAELKFLSVDFQIAQLYSQLAEPSKQHNLKKSILLLLSFLSKLRDYELLSKGDSEKLDRLKENPFEIANLHASAMLRRDEKIANYKLEKSLGERLKLLETFENDEQEYANADEDTIRDLYIQQLRLLTIKSFDSIRLITQELEILQHSPEEPQITEIKDNREKARDPTNFTDRLESISKEFLSKEGKILKPFTIVKREDLKKKVYGTGQYLPTMTVEDYLEQELANGGMVSSAPVQDESSDEDDYEKNDRDTYKAREWDEFTEANRKGSGNTINRG